MHPTPSVAGGDLLSEVSCQWRLYLYFTFVTGFGPGDPLLLWGSHAREQLGYL